MEEKLLTFIQEYQLLKKNKTILVGVSGGPDSMALLHFFHNIKKEWNLRVIAVTVNHQLRGEESGKDIQYVQEMCEKWNIPVVTASVLVEAYKLKHKVSTQVAARKLRYRIYAEQMNIYQADYLALGHHGDDQIETFLMSLIRTTNLSSFTGIPLKRAFVRGEIIRPLLCVTKSEIEQYCLTYQIEPRIDSTNQDTYYTRNYMRNDVVPKLKERNSRLHLTVQRLSQSLHEDEQYLMEQAEEVVKKEVHFDVNQKKASGSIQALNRYPVPLQRRAYRLTLDYLYKELPENLSHKHEQIFLSLLSHQTGNQVVHFPNQLIIEKSYDNIYIYFQSKHLNNSPFHCMINHIPEKIILPNGAILSITYMEAAEFLQSNESKYTFVCPKEQISFPLHIRTRKAGDRMHYKGLQGTKKVKDIFIDAKIPRHQRDSIYVLADHTGEILWLIGLRKKEMTKGMPSGMYVLLEYKEFERTP